MLDVKGEVSYCATSVDEDARAMYMLILSLV